MRFSYLHKKRVICFRRWSRKAYAAFQSLGKHIVIGHVSKSIVEASLRKSGKQEEIRYNPFKLSIIPEENLPPGERNFPFLFVIPETSDTITSIQAHKRDGFIRPHTILLSLKKRCIRRLDILLMHLIFLYKLYDTFF